MSRPILEAANGSNTGMTSLIHSLIYRTTINIRLGYRYNMSLEMITQCGADSTGTHSDVRYNQQFINSNS